MILRDETVFFVLLGSIIFYQLSSFGAEKLLSIIIIIIFAGVAYYYLDKKNIKLIEENAVIENVINKESESRKEVNGEIVNVQKFPPDSKFKFVFKNHILVEIIDDLNILRMFDRARYADLILYMDKLQKVYIYILANRYEPRSYIPTFVDLSDKILEILYSLVFVIPESLRHVYGIDSTEELVKKNTERFVALRTKMVKILQNFAKAEHNIKFLPEVFPRPSNNYTDDKILF